VSAGKHQDDVYVLLSLHHCTHYFQLPGLVGIITLSYYWVLFSLSFFDYLFKQCVQLPL